MRRRGVGLVGEVDRRDDKVVDGKAMGRGRRSSRITTAQTRGDGCIFLKCCGTARAGRLAEKVVGSQLIVRERFQRNNIIRLRGIVQIRAEDSLRFGQ